MALPCHPERSVAYSATTMSGPVKPASLRRDRRRISAPQPRDSSPPSNQAEVGRAALCFEEHDKHVAAQNDIEWLFIVILSGRLPTLLPRCRDPLNLPVSDVTGEGSLLHNREILRLPRTKLYSVVLLCASKSMITLWRLRMTSNGSSVSS